MSEPMTNNKFNPWPMPEPAYTEQYLRKRLVDEGCSCDPLHTANQCGFHSALFAYEARIRSEARAGMREACAKKAIEFSEQFKADYGYRRTGANVAAQLIAEDIRSLPDTAANEAIERIKAEAERKGRLDEAKSAPHDKSCISREWKGKVLEPCNCWKAPRIAALSGKETEHE